MFFVYSFCSGFLAVGLFIVASLLFRPVDWEDGPARVEGVQKLLFVASGAAVLVAAVCFWGGLGELLHWYRVWDGPVIYQSDQPG